MYCILWSLKKTEQWSLFTNLCFVNEKNATEFASKQKSKKHNFKIGLTEEWFNDKRKETKS